MNSRCGAAATQTSAIGQTMDGEAIATADQTSAIGQGEGDAAAVPPGPETPPDPTEEG